MTVDYDSFLSWCENKFDSVVVKGSEIRINSPFTDDSKHHCWCSPAGGKYQREDGCYHCFKTDKKGTLVGLVMLVEACSYAQAKEILSGKTPLRILEQKLEEFFANKIEIVPDKPILELPDYCWPIDEMAKVSLDKMSAEHYLGSRKIPTTGLYFCTAGDYKNRIVIPYYDRNGKLIYFNSRAINEGLRYMGPPKTVGVGKGDVIFMAGNWPKEGKVYVAEGEFDALSLKVCGLNAAACGGRIMSDKQLFTLKDYHICLTLDTDEAGYEGLLSISRRLMKCGVSNISYVRPPEGFKDWNKMLVDLKPEIIVGYIQKCEKLFDEWTSNSLEWNRI